MSEIVNQTELAEILGVSVPTLATLRRQGMPVEKEGGNGIGYEYDAEACVDWFREHRAERSRAEGARREKIAELRKGLFGEELEADDPFDGISPAEIRTLTEAARSRDVLERQRGTLVPLDRVLADYQATFAFIRAQILGLPDKLARELALEPDDVEAVHRISVDTVSTLHRMLRQDEVAGGHVGGSKAPPA